MVNRIALTGMYNFAILLIGIMLLQSCGSSGTSAPSNDTNDNFPYLTAQPTVTPPTVMDGDIVSYTIFATGPLGLGAVRASLTTVALGAGFTSQAWADLTETAPDTWTGTGMIDTSVPTLIESDGYYVQVELALDPTGSDLTTTFYTISTTGTRYTISNINNVGTEVATSSSAYVVNAGTRVTVTVP